MTYSGYKISCKKCGDKVAMLSVDEGNFTPQEMHEECLDTLVRQFNEVLLPEHKGHDFKFVKIVVNSDKTDL